MVDNFAILLSHGFILYVLIQAVRIDRRRGWSEFEEPERDFDSDKQTEHRKMRK